MGEVPGPSARNNKDNGGAKMPTIEGYNKRVPLGRASAEEFFRQGRTSKPKHRVLPAWLIANALLGHDRELAKLAKPVLARARPGIRREVQELTDIEA